MKLSVVILTFELLIAGGIVGAVTTPASGAVQSPPKQWTDLGPHQIDYTQSNGAGLSYSYPFTGRVTAIAVNASNTANIYIGGASGGVWKTTDGGKTWFSTTSGSWSMPVGSIVLSPDGKTLYVGTGEPNHSGDSFVGQGLLTSNNGGRSWTVLGARYFNQTAISFVWIYPSDPSRIVVGTTWGRCCKGLFYPAHYGGWGLYLSTDGGKSWNLIQDLTSRRGVASLVANSTDPSILYAGDFGGGTWVSRDSGSTWSPFLRYSDPSKQGRVTLAYSPATGGGLYQAYSDSSWNLIGIFRYDATSGKDVGLSIPPAPPHMTQACNNQCYYDQVLAVDQTDASHVYFGAVDFYSSTDGGQTWTDHTLNGQRLHNDDHAFAFLPGTPSSMFLGTDGGIYLSADYGATWANLSPGLGITQFYSITVLPSGAIYGGTQDIGCMVSGAGTSWNELFYEDGGWVGYEPSNPSTLYCAGTYHAPTPNRAFEVSNDGGQTWALRATGLNLSDPSQFPAPPFAQDLRLAGTIYAATTRVYKTSNYAQSWIDLTGAFLNKSATALTVAPSNSSVLYLGGPGLVKASLDGGVNWATLPLMKNLVVTSVVADPNNWRTVYVSYTDGSVYAATLTSQGWRATQLPTVPQSVDVLKFDSSLGVLFSGTDAGVYYLANGAWLPLGTGLPGAEVYDMVLRSNQIFAGTHGRGVWALNFSQVSATASRLSPGYTWSLTLGNVTASSSGSSLSFLEPVGAYQFTVKPPPGWAANPTSGVLVVGLNSTISVSFQQLPQTTSSSSTTVSSSNAVSSSTASTNGSTSSANTSGGGGIPEFPYQPLIALVFGVLAAVSYLIVRGRGSQHLSRLCGSMDEPLGKRTRDTQF